MDFVEFNLNTKTHAHRVGIFFSLSSTGKRGILFLAKEHIIVKLSNEIDA